MRCKKEQSNYGVAKLKILNRIMLRYVFESPNYLFIKYTIKTDCPYKLK